MQVGHLLRFALKLLSLEAKNLAVLHLDLLDLELVEFVFLAAELAQLSDVVEQLALLSRVVFLSELQLSHHLSAHLANLRLVLVLQVLHLLHDVLRVEVGHLLRHFHLALLVPNGALRVFILLACDLPKRPQPVALDLEKVPLFTFPLEFIAKFYAKCFELLPTHSGGVDAIDDS